MRLLFNRLTFPSSVLLDWTTRRNLPWASAETGLHAVSLLGEAAPRVARMRETGGLSGTVEILAWSHDPLPATEVATCETREIPLAAIENQVLSFRLRCQPTIRRGGKEIDAWVAERTRPEAIRAPDRRHAYKTWLEARLKGAEIQDLIVARAGATRIDLPGKAPFNKPAAELEGLLRVTDAAAFAACLVRGIGRQARLGFGMMLIGRA